MARIDPNAPNQGRTFNTSPVLGPNPTGSTGASRYGRRGFSLWESTAMVQRPTTGVTTSMFAVPTVTAPAVSIPMREVTAVNAPAVAKPVIGTATSYTAPSVTGGVTGATIPIKSVTGGM